MRMKINITALVLAACIFTQYLPVSASVLDTKTQVLTVEEAAKNAISNNTTIKNAADSESLRDENYRKALDNFYAATTASVIINAEVSLTKLEMDRSMNLKNIESQKENVEYNIKKYFNTIINAEKKDELYEE